MCIHYPLFGVRVAAAIAMCGDAHDGLELALGAPRWPEPRDAGQTGPIVADATGDTMAAFLTRELDQLRYAIEQSFPLASAFIRPGFHETIRE